jgi:hypothetical protein
VDGDTVAAGDLRVARVKKLHVRAGGSETEAEQVALKEVMHLRSVLTLALRHIEIQPRLFRQRERGGARHASRRDRRAPAAAEVRLPPQHFNGERTASVRHNEHAALTTVPPVHETARRAAHPAPLSSALRRD